MRKLQTPLAELRRRLKQQPAPQRAVAPSAPEDDATLLASALQGVQALPDSGRAEIARAKPQPRPRARSAEEQAEARERARPQAAEDDWLPESWFKDTPQPVSTSATPELAAALRGVRRLEPKRVELETPRPRPIPLQHLRDEQAALAESIYAPTSLDLHLEGGDELFYLANGVPRAVLRDLRRGRWVIQDQVDLHGCNRDEARELLAACMGRWRRDGTRCVRVVHGKGRGSPGREPVLKRLVAGWLMNYQEVSAYCQARLPEGGAGALIVLFKSSRPAPRLQVGQEHGQ